MATKANKEIIEWEIGVKNRKAYSVMADQLTAQDWDGRLVFKLRGSVIMVVANQKWDYVRRVTPFPADNGPFEYVRRIDPLHTSKETDARK